MAFPASFFHRLHCEILPFSGKEARADTTAPGLSKVSKELAYRSLSLQERRAYEKYLDVIMVQNDAIDTAKLEGRIEARAKALAENNIAREIAQKMKAVGMDVSMIAATTGLSEDEIGKL